MPTTPHTADRTPPSPGRWILAVAVTLAVLAYAYGLDSIKAPTIGDESLYIQIARVTARSGRLLPLQSESGINDTKPPLLFWQGAVSTGLGSSWELWRLRLPGMAMSLATAALAALLAARIAGRAPAMRAGLVFLGFISTIQYGRPFLTNAGETLFLFLPLVLVHDRRRTGPLLGIACGLSLGVAALYKSFFLVVPGTFALVLVLAHRDGWQLRPFLRQRGAFLAIAALLGLLVFGLWPALDPRPDVIWSQFVVGENAGKLRIGDYASGLFQGDYPIWEIWIGDLKNAGLYAPLLLALLWDLWRRRRALPSAEAELWLYVLAFLIVYSLPTQRQSNYLLPTMAALAVLLALRWEALPALVFQATLALLALAGFAVPVFQWMVARRLAVSIFPLWSVLLPVALGTLALVGTLRPRFGRAALPFLVLLTLVVGSAVIAPFSRRFPDAALAEVRGRQVLVPDRYTQSQEHYRFLLPGADVRGYPCPAGPVDCPAPPAEAGLHAAIFLDTPRALPPGYEPVAASPHFRERHTNQQILEILGGRLELLVEWLVLARPARPVP